MALQLVINLPETAEYQEKMAEFIWSSATVASKKNLIERMLLSAPVDDKVIDKILRCATEEVIKEFKPIIRDAVKNDLQQALDKAIAEFPTTLSQWVKGVFDASKSAVNERLKEATHREIYHKESELYGFVRQEIRDMVGAAVGDEIGSCTDSVREKTMAIIEKQLGSVESELAASILKNGKGHASRK